MQEMVRAAVSREDIAEDLARRCRMTAAVLKVPPSFMDLLGQFFPPVLDKPPPYDLDELSLVGERQSVDGIQEFCKAHPVLPPQFSWIV